VLKAFEINELSLNMFKTKQEKTDYIIKCMDKSISQLFNNFKEKQEIKERKQEDNEKKEQIRTKNEKMEDDYFPWLKLKTQYENLRKRLSTIIVEKLNDYDNLILVLQKLKEKQHLKDQGKETAAQNTKFNLQNIDMTSTKDIFLNMSNYGNPRTQQFLSRLGLTKNDNSFNVSKRQVMSVSLQNNKESNINKTIYSSPQKNKEEDDDIFWTQDKEDIFKQQKNVKKKLYTYEVSSSSWNSVGFLPFVQKYFMNMKKQMQRDHLISKFSEGEVLSDEELKLLANTSKLLNACINKKFVQSAVDIIDDDIIANLELGLAENIIKVFEEIQKQIKQSRQEFINQKLKKSYSQLANYQANIENQQKIALNRKIIQRKHRMLSTVCNKMQKQGKFDQSYLNNVLGEEKINEFLQEKINQYELIQQIKSLDIYSVQTQEQQKLKILQEIQKQQKKKSQKDYIKHLSQPIHKNFSILEKKHTYHPPSKVFLFPKDRNIQEYTAEELEKYNESDKIMNQINHEQQNIYKLNIKSPQAYKKSYLFKQFYSSGPIQKEEKDQKEQTLQNYNEKEIKKIILIQKKIRMFHQQTKMKLQLETKKNQRQEELKHKIDLIASLQKNTSVKITPNYKQNTIEIVQLKNSSILSQKDDILEDFSQKKNQNSTFSSTQYTQKKDYQKITLKRKPIQYELKNLKLIEAAKSNKFWIINSSQFIYSKNDFYQAIDMQRMSALHWAVFHKNIEFVQWLLDQEADPNYADKKGNTSTHLAFKSGKIDIILLIIKYGGDLNCINQFGETPLAMGNAQILKMLGLQNGVSLILQGGQERIFDNNQLLKNINKNTVISIKQQINNNKQVQNNNQRQQKNCT
ncbi:IQ calmodulin-binding motif family protein, putative, partial [Ichthyophthirius multifiliis]